MSTVVGRLREDPALPMGIKYILVSHNTAWARPRVPFLVGEYLIKKGIHFVGCTYNPACFAWIVAARASMVCRSASVGSP